MGFGLLLVGYFTATVMSLNVCGGAFAFVGYLLMIFGAKKLMQYDRSFLYLLIASIVMLMLSAVLAVYDVSSLMYKYMLMSYRIISDSLADKLMNIRLVLDLLFVAVLCYCVKNIAKNTGADKITYKAVRNFVFFCIFFVFQGLVWLATEIDVQFLKEFVVGTALPIWVVIIKLVCLILNCLMLFSCYSKICDVEDMDMPQKPSRFGFINRRREEKEQKRQAYIEEANRYLEQKREKKNKKS